MHLTELAVHEWGSFKVSHKHRKPYSVMITVDDNQAKDLCSILSRACKIFFTIYVSLNSSN